MRSGLRAAARRLAAVGSLLLLSAVPAGCGYSRTPVPSVVAPSGFTGDSFPRVGINLFVPRGWTESVSALPLAATISSGPAVIAVWRYRRSAPPPSDPLGLAAARQALVSAARGRDSGLRLIRTKLTRVGRAPAIVLDAFEQVNGHRRRVRSLHIYVQGAEIVIDEYAPPAQFHAVDHEAFSPVIHGIRLRRGVVP